jgi:hypothetical protein
MAKPLKTFCLQCGSEFFYRESRQTGKFCSSSCCGKYKTNTLVKEWLFGNLSALNAGGQMKDWVKNWVKDRDNYTCVLCGWSKQNPITGTIPVEVDHIDGDHKNNSPNNLRTICPNCHSLTDTWKNTGNTKDKMRGRSYRRKFIEQ